MFYYHYKWSPDDVLKHTPAELRALSLFIAEDIEKEKQRAQRGHGRG